MAANADALRHPSARSVTQPSSWREGNTWCGSVDGHAGMDSAGLGQAVPAAAG